MRIVFKVWLFIVVSLFFSSQSSAQLATNIAIDAKAMAMGNAVTADPPGIMAIHFNPAGLAKLEGRRADFQFLAAGFALEAIYSAPPDYGVFGFSDDPVVCADPIRDGNAICSEFIESKSTVEGVSLYLPVINELVDLPPGPIAGGPLPSVSFRAPDSKFTFASALYAPLLAGFYRDENDPGRFLGKRVALERITYLSPSVGFEVSDELMFGASIGFSYQAVALETDFRSPNELTGFGRLIEESICAPFTNQDSNIVTDLVLFGICNSDEGLGPYKSLAEVSIIMDQTLSPSYNVGVLWEPTDNFAWGAVWQSEAKLKLTGTYKIDYGAATSGTINGIGSSATGCIVLQILSTPCAVSDVESGLVSMKLVQPAHFQTGIKFKPFDRLQINMDLGWTQFSKWDSFKIDFADSPSLLSLARLLSPESTLSTLVMPLGFQDVWSLGFGMEYSYTNRMKFRLGYEPRASAVPDNRRSPLVPINDAVLYGAGIGYQWDTDTEIDITVSYLLSEDNIPANTSCSANCTGIDNAVYNPYAGLDIKTKAEIFYVGFAFRTAW